MFTKILIANRGEIAVRIARTCRALGVGVIAVYSDADRTALHVRVADEAYRLGPPPARESYLNIDLILAAAQASGAEAVHPGYGFLSENAEFAARVVAAGLTFIGPPAAAIRAMGDKAAAKRLMQAAGVPVVPGYQGEEQDDERLQAEAQRIGYPLLIKAAAGGGGRGMREVSGPEEFAERLQSARREALAAFGDDRMLLERLVRDARHVEVQVFGDDHGNMIYLGERDCSLQRRHQKVVEEAPSPAVNETLRRRMGEAAVTAARSAGYRNAGTVEFLLAPDGAFYFLEMNTRLQVEHPVTEAITGLDLVAWQLAVAAGEPLPLRQDQVSLAGHAIEVRLYAEDPFKQYLPAAGALRRLTLPAGEGVRVDSGFTTGATVSPYYDALLAKIIVSGADRVSAVGRLRAALGETVVGGVATNLPLLCAVAESPAFAAGAATTAFLEPFWAASVRGETVPLAALFGAAGFILTASARADGDPWASGGPWRATPVARTLRLRCGSREAALAARPGVRRDEWLLVEGDDEHEVAFERVAADELLMLRDARVSRFRLGADGHGGRMLALDGERYPLEILAAPAPDSAAAGGHGGGVDGRLIAPMPGLVVKLNVAVGDRVRAHQTLAVLEAMKIEHAIQAPLDGVVMKVNCVEGGRVLGGAVLIELEPGESEE